ncbi:oxidoreductase [Vibrio hannami]|uniref:oxidoreductase n=1 Tax=Vibrio hannami TaxID=2717094 RepID=UPI00240F0429|nr:oxidoreductase [Vibrio hannami]MDG3084990.1 oxidoreductase [Vibrio hannami]
MRLLFLLLIALSSPLAGNASTLFIEEGENTLATYTINDLQKMPELSYTTPLPWIKGDATFTGVSLGYLINHVAGSIPDTLKLRALNDYSATISKSEIEKYDPIVAYLRDGKAMKIRDKGPFWLIYSLEKYPELDNPKAQGQMVWQLERIIITNNEK